MSLMLVFSFVVSCNQYDDEDELVKTIAEAEDSSPCDSAMNYSNETAIILTQQHTPDRPRIELRE